MTTFAVVLAAVLAAGLVIWVARPFLVATRGEETLADGAEIERLRLLDERDRALAALKELEFDHRTGKISEADYAALVGALRAEAAAALAALDAVRADGLPQTPAPSDPAVPAEARKEHPR